MTESRATDGLAVRTQDFAAARTSCDLTSVAMLFAPDGLWRDVIAFGWTLATHEGADAVHARAAVSRPFAATHARTDGDGSAQGADRQPDVLIVGAGQAGNGRAAQGAGRSGIADRQASARLRTIALALHVADPPQSRPIDPLR